MTNIWKNSNGANGMDKDYLSEVSGC